MKIKYIMKLKIKYNKIFKNILNMDNYIYNIIVKSGDVKLLIFKTNPLITKSH